MSFSSLPLNTKLSEPIQLPCIYPQFHTYYQNCEMAHKKFLVRTYPS